MLRFLYQLLMVSVFVLIPTVSTFASSIIPPKDYGELVRLSDLVVIAKAVDGEGFRRGEVVMTGTRFEVIQVLKGSLATGQSFTVETIGGIAGEFGLHISGSPQFTSGKTYLLSLTQFNGAWVPRVMSYGLLVEHTLPSGEKAFTHMAEVHDLNVVIPDGLQVETVGMYKANSLITHVKQLVEGTTSWNKDRAGYQSDMVHEHVEAPVQMNGLPGPIVQLSAPPAGCEYMAYTGTKIRWNRFATDQSVNVNLTSGASATAVTAAQTAVNGWKALSGIDVSSLTYNGAAASAATCTSGEIDLNNSGISLYNANIFLDDPCGEIADLTSCAGTLAVAGPAFNTGNTHTFNSETWITALIGYMIINNGTPGCLSTTQYNQVVTHELGHIIGFGHHTGGTANMNATCCNPISTLDQTCAAYIYGDGSSSNPVPTITSISPTSAQQGSTGVSVAVNGTNFMAGGTISVSGSGITITAASLASATRINMTMDISASATTGVRNITVTNPAPGGGTSNAGSFSVTAANNPIPGLREITPNTGAQGSAVTVTLGGSNFTANSTVNVSGTGITVSNVTFVNSTQLTALFTIAAGATTGNRNVTVTNPAPGGGTSDAAVFSVTAGSNPVPNLTSISPNSGVSGNTYTITLNGTNFVTGSTVSINGAGVNITSVTYVSSTQLTATLLISAGAAAGGRTVTVTNPAPGGGTSSGVTFTITVPQNPVPTLTSLAPNSGSQGSSQLITLNGSNFIAGSTVGITGSGVGISNISFVSSNQLIAQFTVEANATTGDRTVTVTNSAPGGGTSSGVTFSVSQGSNPSPSITSITPSSFQAGTNTSIIINGSNFVSGASVSVTGNNQGGSEVSLSNVQVISSTQITATLVVLSSVSQGTRGIVVTNPSPGGGNSNTVNITITQANNPTPTFTTLSPNSGTQGTTVNVTITGTGFTNQTTIVIPGTGMTVTNQVLVSSTQITASFVIANTATTGSRNITISNPTPGGGTSSALPFTVNAAFVNKAPTMNTIANISFLHTAQVQNVALSGISAGQGETQNLTITATADDPLLIPYLIVDYVSPQTTGLVKLLNDRKRVGSTIIRVKVKDNGGTANGGVDSLIRVFNVTVQLDTDLELDEDGLPKTYQLSQNYPNPFNPTTQISFALPQAGWIRLSVYDMMGRERMVLADGDYSAGKHSVTLDAKGLASGTYIYTLRAVDFSTSKKFTLLK